MIDKDVLDQATEKEIWDKIDELKTLLNENIENFPLMNKLAHQYLKIKRFDEGENLYKQYLELYPESGNAHFQIAYLEYRKSGMENPKKIIELTDKAIKFGISHPTLWGIRGIAFRVINNIYEARFCFEKTLDLEPDNEFIQIQLKKVNDLAIELNETLGTTFFFIDPPKTENPSIVKRISSKFKEFFQNSSSNE